MTLRKEHKHPEFVVESISTPEMRRPVTKTINCGSKAEIAQVVSTVETSVLAGARSALIGGAGSRDLNTHL